MKGRKRQRIFVLNDPHALRICGSLAEEIGFNESVVLLQLEFLISISENVRDGRVWTYQSLQNLKDLYFPWWSIATISRTIKSLESMGFIDIGNYNRLKYDRTQWFALNYEGLERLESLAIFQNEKSKMAKREIEDVEMQDGTDQNETTIPETTSETTPDTPTASGENALMSDVLPPTENPDSVSNRSHIPAEVGEPSTGDYGGDLQRRANSGESWTVPPEAGGADRLGDSVIDAFCQFIGISASSLPKKKWKQWVSEFRKIASEWGVEATTLVSCIEAMPRSEFHFKSYSTPYQKSFQDDLYVLIARHVGDQPLVRERDEPETTPRPVDAFM